MSRSHSTYISRRLLFIVFTLVALVSSLFVATTAAQDEGGASAPQGPAYLDRASTSTDPNSPPIEYGPSAPVVMQDFTEGFEDISTLMAEGWAMQNNSTTPGLTNWFQGNDLVFPAHQGPPTSYIGANFNNVGGSVGTISNWLMTPEITLQNGAEFSFWTRTAAGSIWPDRLQVRMSTSGSSTNVGTGPEDVGDFDELLLDINSNLTVGGYPEVWTEYVVTISGLAGPTQGRLAFRYYVTDGGPAGDNSNYIGIDTVEYTEGGGGPTPTATTAPPTPTATATGGATSIQLSTLESNGGGSNPWLLLSLVGIAGLAGAAWVGARRSR